MKQKELLNRLRIIQSFVREQFEDSELTLEVTSAYGEALEQAIDQLRWRSVEDGYGDSDDIIVYLKEPKDGRHIHSAKMHEGKPFVVGHHFYYDCSEITHWMPLPPAPDA